MTRLGIKVAVQDESWAAAHSAMALEWAWQQWAAESCVERHGGHLWVLELGDPDDEPYVGVYCESCPATGDDLLTDLPVYLGLDYEDFTVAEGLHTADRYLTIPVDIEVGWHYVSNPISGTEWDFEVIVSPRGPAVDSDGDLYTPAQHRRITTIVPVWDVPGHMEEA